MVEQVFVLISRREWSQGKEGFAWQTKPFWPITTREKAKNHFAVEVNGEEFFVYFGVILWYEAKLFTLTCRNEFFSLQTDEVHCVEQPWPGEERKILINQKYFSIKHFFGLVALVKVWFFYVRIQGKHVNNLVCFQTTKKLSCSTETFLFGFLNEKSLLEWGEKKKKAFGGWVVCWAFFTVSSWDGTHRKSFRCSAHFFAF